MTSTIPANHEPSQRQPNVVIIYMDDLAWGDLACHGNPYIRTPHLDRLFAEGTRLTRYHSYPVCTPARSALMTGRYPQRTRAFDTYCGRSMMDPDEVTLAEVLREAGYATALSGKWHLGDNYPLRPLDQGFDEVLMHNGGGLCQPANFGHDDYFGPDLMHNGVRERHHGYCTDIFTDHAIRFIEQHRDHPFFTYLATNAPHTPLKAPRDDAERFLAMGLPDKWAWVYAMVENIDDNVGRVLGKLDELGLTDDTIVIFSSDHGPCTGAADEELGNRWNGGLRDRKGTIYDGGLRTPFLVRWPRAVQAGRNIDRIANPIDVLPTLASLCGAAAPTDRTIDGVDLSPLLLDQVLPTEWPDRQLFIQWHRGDVPERYRNCAVVEQHWKLVRADDGIEPESKPKRTGGGPEGEELYAIDADPGEYIDVAVDHPGVVTRLHDAYDRWFDDIAATRGETTFDPPAIHIGTPHENPTMLSRQDWRVRGPDGFDDVADGYWMVNAAPVNPYLVTVYFATAPPAGTVTLRYGERTVEQPIDGNTSQVHLDPIRDMPGGRITIEAWIRDGQVKTMADFIEIGTTA